MYHIVQLFVVRLKKLARLIYVIEHFTSDDKEHDGCEEGVEQIRGRKINILWSLRSSIIIPIPTTHSASKEGSVASNERTTGASRDFNGCA